MTKEYDNLCSHCETYNKDVCVKTPNVEYNTNGNGVSKCDEYVAKGKEATMTAEWMMTIAEIEDITCPTDGKVNGVDCHAECFFCDYYLQHMVNTAQRKLLEYLIAQRLIDWMVAGPMLKKLEGK